jgi:hypothetical protein
LGAVKEYVVDLISSLHDCLKPFPTLGLQECAPRR